MTARLTKQFLLDNLLTSDRFFSSIRPDNQSPAELMILIGQLPAEDGDTCLFRTMEVDMSYTITDECISCGSCQAECPQEAIFEKEEIFAIDSEKCDDCGTCASNCPVEACIPLT